MPRLITKTVVADFRNRLCEVAAELFAETGLDGFNMRELAKRLRVSPMTAYRYFRDKDEILAALRARAFGRFAGRLEAAHATPGSTVERSAALADAYVQFVLQEQGNYRLMFDLFQSPSQTVPELALQERRARNAIADHARLLVEDGLFSGEPELIGQLFWSALHGVAALHLAGKLALAEFDRVISETVRLLANSYRADGTGPATDKWQGFSTHQPAPTNYCGLAAQPAE